MSVTLMKQEEATPAAYPDVPAGLSTEAVALDTDAIWERLESWIAYRYSERDVVWVVWNEGADFSYDDEAEWVPPLAPATITTVEYWDDTAEAWVETTLSTSPLDGFLLPDTTYYRFTGTVGVDASAQPAAIEEAYTRLAEYLVDVDVSELGVSQKSVSIGAAVDINETRNPNRLARALQFSGAADLLRSYRKAK